MQSCYALAFGCYNNYKIEEKIGQMGRTTIDGLAVRSSSQRSVPRAPRKSTNVVDVTTHRTRPTGKSLDGMSAKQSTPKTATRYTDPLQDFVDNSDNGFLDPVESFGYNSGYDSMRTALATDDFGYDNTDNFASDNGADWSNLLGELNAAAVGVPRYNRLALGAGVDEGQELEWNERDEIPREIDKPEPEIEEKPRRATKKRTRRKRVPVGKIIALTLVILLIAGASVVYFWGDSLIARLTGGKSGFWSTISALVSDTVPFDEDSNGRTNVLVFGTSGYNMAGENGDSTHDGAQLTDSIMVISFDQDTKDVAMISLPRDLKVSMACYAGKINEVFTCNNPDGDNEEAGARALMKQVGEILGMDFQYYAHINWGSLVSIVDTIGGITVTFDEDIFDYGWTNAVATAGVPVTINGEQALGFARARHGTEGGDFTRGNSQQKILEAIIEKLLHQGVGLDEAFGLLNILGDNLRTNFSTDNIKAALAMASDFSVSSMRQIPLVDYENNVYYVQSSNIDGISFVVPSAGIGNYSAIKAYVRQMLTNDPIVREGASIAIYNGTEVAGLAGMERDKLESDGYIVSNIGDAETWVCESNFCIYDLSDGSMTGTAAALADRYGVAVKSGEELPAELYSAGVDFVIIIGQSE